METNFMIKIVEGEEKYLLERNPNTRRTIVSVYMKNQPLAGDKQNGYFSRTCVMV